MESTFLNASWINNAKKNLKIGVNNKHDPSVSLIHSENDDNSNLLYTINKKLHDLTIDAEKNEEENLSSNQRNEELAGNIEKTITSLGVILVKPATTNNLLNINTPIFLHSKNSTGYNKILLGRIEDIFGTVGDPMYSVRFEQNIDKLSLTEKTDVYYHENHPDTTTIKVEMNANRCHVLIRKKKI